MVDGSRGAQCGCGGDRARGLFLHRGRVQQREVRHEAGWSAGCGRGRLPLPHRRPSVRPATFRHRSRVPALQPYFRLFRQARDGRAPRGLQCGQLGHSRVVAQLCRHLDTAGDRFALGFWGLTRSVRYTIGSIRANVYAALARERVPFSAFLHTYDTARIESTTPDAPTDDGNTAIDWRRDVNELMDFSTVAKWYAEGDRPSATLQVDSQYYFDSKFSLGLLMKILRFGDFERQDTVPPEWLGRPASSGFKNLMRELYSLKRLTALWQHHQGLSGRRFRAVMYVRPDMIWTSPFPPAAISAFRDYRGAADRIFLPSFFGQLRGVAGDEAHVFQSNDRAAIGTPGAMLHYGNRFDYAYNFGAMGRMPVQSERLVSWVLCMLSHPGQPAAGDGIFRPVHPWWISHAANSTAHGGCLNVGIGREDLPRGKHASPRPYVSGAWGVRARATGLIFRNDRGKARSLYQEPPDCTGIRASILAASSAMRELVCGERQLEGWCSERCLAAAPDVHDWRRLPARDGKMAFAQSGESWEDLVRVDPAHVWSGAPAPGGGRYLCDGGQESCLTAVARVDRS
eukprot:TRINITY_DN17192_c0_g1_i1.p1 TRINITY_DN17192_c0_g1~~TRINITY_DN17192_c0_g1_i1.p1  ORF type:complete len:593 (+),score=97.29 TRINITY_DN17192_c0_g1_i1:70-1779(+)